MDRYCVIFLALCVYVSCGLQPLYRRRVVKSLSARGPVKGCLLLPLFTPRHRVPHSPTYVGRIKEVGDGTEIFSRYHLHNTWTSRQQAQWHDIKVMFLVLRLCFSTLLQLRR